MKEALRSPLCSLAGVEYPIVQTGMGWVSGPELTAATANAGGLGILAAAVMDMDELRVALKELRDRTDKPFGVNLRADQPDIADRCDLLVREGIRVASFAMAPRRELVQRLKDGGVVVIPSIGARRHAEKVAEWGVDAVLVQGGEGGGHTGSVPTTLLVPQVVDAVDIPVIAAGGFFDGRGLVAALAYGAVGIAMGTRFLLTRDSQVPQAVKDMYLAKTVADTVVTTRTVLEPLCERHGWELIAVESGFQVLRVVRDTAVDLVLINPHVQAAGVSGVDIARTIKASAQFRKIPVLFVLHAGTVVPAGAKVDGEVEVDTWPAVRLAHDR